MTFKTFSIAGLQKLIAAIQTLHYGLFIVEGLNLELEEELSEPEYQCLLADLNYEHLFTM